MGIWSSGLRVFDAKGYGYSEIRITGIWNEGYGYLEFTLQSVKIAFGSEDVDDIISGISNQKQAPPPPPTTHTHTNK